MPSTKETEKLNKKQLKCRKSKTCKLQLTRKSFKEKKIKRQQKKTKKRFLFSNSQKIHRL